MILSVLWDIGMVRRASQRWVTLGANGDASRRGWRIGQPLRRLAILGLTHG